MVPGCDDTCLGVQRVLGAKLRASFLASRGLSSRAQAAVLSRSWFGPVLSFTPRSSLGPAHFVAASGRRSERLAAASRQIEPLLLAQPCWCSGGKLEMSE